MKRFLFYAFAMLAIIACTESETDDNGSDNGGGNNPSAPSITLNQSIVTFDDAAGEEQVSFSATADWIAELVNDRADSWLSISPKSGAAGNASIAIKATENDTPDDRSATIRLKAGSAMKTISVTQKQKDALTVTSSKFEVEANGGEVQIEVKANINFEYVIDESAKEWVAYEGTRAMKTSTLTFKVAENDDTERREGTITIKSGEFNEVVTIYQAGCEPSIVISKSEYVVSSNSETIAVEVKSNVDVAVEMPTDVDWISENTSRATSTNTYRFDIAANEGYDQRTAEIKFTNKENNLSEVVTIVQSQKDAIVLAKSEYEFGVNGGNLDFEIQTNVDITVKISDNAKNWIQQVETRGLETKALYFNVAACSAEEDREGTITISGGNATQTITVKQSGLKEILEKEREALIAFYNATGGDSWKNNTNWCSDQPVKEWYGVKTNTRNQVVGLDLDNNNLTGYIPETIDELTNLEYLYLYVNQLTGELPATLGNLKNLTSIYMQGNQLSGNIPESIGNLTNLKTLHIYNNNFTGELPASMANLKQLKGLDVSFCNLTGGFPESICNLPLLNYIHLSENELTGELPESLGNLANLEVLYIDNNLFTGNIPESIGNLTKLEHLTLSNNEFIGELPESLGNLTNLTLFDASNNKLTGAIPESIGNLTNLECLRLNSNDLTGELPASMGNLTNLDVIFLSHNNLSGKVPSSVMQLDWWTTYWSFTLDQNGEGFSKEGLVIPAPKFNEKTIDGKSLDYSVYAENEYTILYNYFDWCPYSTVFTPTLVELYDGYKDKGLEVIAFSSGATPETYSKYAETHNTKWPYITLTNNADLFYSHTWMSPAVCVVDKEGYIVFNHISDKYQDLGKFLLEKLGEPSVVELYKSTDYSADGKVKTLQKAAKGDGIDIVLMGDAYSDRLIAGGTYDKVMNTAMEKFFMEEPYKSFRDHFNVYSVTAVSDNEVYTDDSSTAFAGYFGEGTLVGGNDQRVFSYAQKAIGADRMDEALIVVMMNSGAYAGTCWMYHSSADTGDCGNGVSISYFPVGSDDTALAQVLHHEAGGHGFSKLADEYAYENMGAMPDAEISSRKSYEPYGWWKNADFTSDPTKVKWSTFLSDARYANDGLGVFEGAFTYWTRAYRPTENSIMRHNTGGFNAPSREAIYYRIHKLAYGAEWEYDYEKFVEWDARNRKTAAATRGVPYRLDVPIDFKPLHAPVVVNTSWREAKNTAPAKRAIRQSVGNSVSGSYRASSGARPQVSVLPVTHDRTITMSDGITRSWSTNTTKQGR